MKSPKLLSIVAVTFLLLIPFMVCGQSKDKNKEIPKKYRRMSNPYADNESDVFIGETVYKLHCFSCHGYSGSGNGPKASSLDSEIGSLAENKFQSYSDGEIYYKIMFGNDHMSSYEKIIKTDEDKWQLVNYIRTFKK